MITMGLRKRSGSVLKQMVKALQHNLLSIRSTNKYSNGDDDFDNDRDGVRIPKHIKAGHFVVVAAQDNGEPCRFVVSLRCLSNPTFLGLLERAQEEFGYCHEGALVLPCRSDELEAVLREL